MILRYTVVAALVVVAACGRADGRAPAGATPPAAAAETATPTVVFLGTSLTAGLGLDPGLAYPALVQAKIDSAGFRYRVVNAGVSGETSAGALRRIDWVLRDRPAVLVIETGANDALRGQNPDSTRANIQAIIQRARTLAPPPRIVLVGMEALPNYGPLYARRFRRIYPDLAKRNDLPLVPFLLAGVAGVDSLNQPDGLHPTEAGQRIVANTVWRTLAPVLRSGPG
jgi:acyl-CoA thioesterase I